jgi:DNA repair protein RecN (Recombination protein N)
VLRELRIRNYAVIDRLDLELPEGLAAFTGETGAGKSIIIGALALALGARAQPEQLRSGAPEILVEARFDGPLPPSAERMLESAGLAGGGEILLRRVVPAAGKSRAYVNDGAVSVATLEGIGRELVDIHGQHQHQSLLRPETHLDFLDGFAGLTGSRADFADLFGKWTEMRQERARLAAREEEKEQRLDFLVFQKEEIEKAGLRPGEDRELEAQREVLRHTERLAAAAGEAEELLYSGDSGAAGAVSQAGGRLRDLAGIDPALGPISRLLEECQIRLEEAGRGIQDYHRRLESDPERLQEVEDRLAEINRMKKKFGGDLETVFERLDEIRKEIDGHEAGGERIALLDRELPALAEELSRRASSLSRIRRKALKELERKILSELKLLNLPGSAFAVDLKREEDPSGGVEVDGESCRIDERGADRVEFLLSANPGEPLKPLAKVASGGELSRIMLAVKTVLSDVDRIPTLIFDEVDIGIGGKVARLVGERLKGLSSGRQILCVTHLPQIASLADSHYNISKYARKGRTFVAVEPLRGPARTEEIARMLGGKTVTDATRRHAAEMLGLRS